MCKFNKALYGLKQAPPEWNAKIDEFLVGQLGFETCPADPCVYLKWDFTLSKLMIIALYVRLLDRRQQSGLYIVDQEGADQTF